MELWIHVALPFTGCVTLGKIWLWPSAYSSLKWGLVSIGKEEIDKIWGLQALLAMESFLQTKSDAEPEMKIQNKALL